MRKSFYHITSLVSNVIYPLRILLSHTRVKKDFMTSQVKVLYICIPTQKFLNMADLHGQMSMFWNLIFFLYLICWIQSCDKKNLTFDDCCDRILLNSS